MPQLVLRGFANDKKRIATVTLPSPTPVVQSVQNTAAENNYNTVELADGEKSDLAERTIAAHIEGPAAAPLERIGAGAWLSGDDERAAVALFLTLQCVRVPIQRAQMDSLASLMMKLDVAAGGPNAMRKALESGLGRPVSDAEVQEAWDSVKHFDEWEVSLPREHHVIESMKLALDFAPLLNEHFDWSVMRWQRKHLLTCDAPLLLTPPPDAPLDEPVGLMTAGRIWFPVTRTTALVLTHRALKLNLDGVALNPTAAAARRLNRMLVLSAYRRVFHHPDDSLPGLVGDDFTLPEPRLVTHEDEHTRQLREGLKSMAEWHFANPGQPHPMSGDLPDPASGIEPWARPGN